MMIDYHNIRAFKDKERNCEMANNAAKQATKEQANQKKTEHMKCFWCTDKGSG